VGGDTYPVVADAVKLPLVEPVGVPDKTPAGLSVMPSGNPVAEYD
jgi:hypothetical protein